MIFMGGIKRWCFDHHKVYGPLWFGDNGVVETSAGLAHRLSTVVDDPVSDGVILLPSVLYQVDDSVHCEYMVFPNAIVAQALLVMAGMYRNVNPKNLRIECFGGAVYYISNRTHMIDLPFSSEEKARENIGLVSWIDSRVSVIGGVMYPVFTIRKEMSHVIR